MDQEELEAAQKFELDNPELVCRWRLAGGVLPLDNRHLRALSRRVVAQKDVSPHLIAWAKQHIEGTLKEGSQEYPDGVLMILLESNGQAAMTVGPYQSLEESSVLSLAGRARISQREEQQTHCAPEVLWLVKDGKLISGISEESVRSGATSLVLDLAQTLHEPTEFNPDVVAQVFDGTADFDEAFLTSDEHGVVCASDAEGEIGERFLFGYKKLCEIKAAK